jgi:hypothetical protein
MVEKSECEKRKEASSGILVDEEARVDWDSFSLAGLIRWQRTAISWRVQVAGTESRPFVLEKAGVVRK